MRLEGTELDITQKVVCKYPGSVLALENVRRQIPHSRREVYTYQALVLYSLVKIFDPERILEIGTAYGYTAAIMAEATDSVIATLNPNGDEFRQARENLKPWSNVVPMNIKSWTYLDTEDTFDFVFVDGDHARVRRDLPWWNKVDTGGLFLFHDYSPHGSGRPTPTVYRVVNNFSDWLGREPDVLVVDDADVGMAGFIKHDNDPAYS